MGTEVDLAAGREPTAAVGAAARRGRLPLVRQLERRFLGVRPPFARRRRNGVLSRPAPWLLLLFCFLFFRLGRPVAGVAAQAPPGGEAVDYHSAVAVVAEI